MDATATHPADPVELVRRLDPNAISPRLDQLDREREALLVLLRAARRARRRDPAAANPGGGRGRAP